MPNGSLLKQYLPNGVMKVVRMEFICKGNLPKARCCIKGRKDSGPHELI